MKNDLAGQITGPVLELGFGEPNEIRRYTPWDIDFRQIEPGPLNTRVFIRPSVSVNLLKIHMNRSVHLSIGVQS